MASNVAAMSATPAARSAAGSWARREVDAGIARRTILPTQPTGRAMGRHRAASAVKRRMPRSVKEAGASREEGLAALGAHTSRGRPRPPGAILVVCSLGYRGLRF